MKGIDKWKGVDYEYAANDLWRAANLVAHLKAADVLSSRKKGALCRTISNLKNNAEALAEIAQALYSKEESNHGSAKH